jgi:heterodisulfide reductase subunit A
VDRVEGKAGDFKVTLTKKPRYIIEEKCTGCTTCVEYCPVQYPDPFNQDHPRTRRSTSTFPRPSPGRLYRRKLLYLKEKKCLICESVCQADAIDLHQKPEKVEINVGAILLSLGIEPFDPRCGPEYRYGEIQNVVTSMDYERLLCATGPYGGEVLRASDRSIPTKSPGSVRGLQAGHRGEQQLLLGGLLHLHPEAGDFDQGSRRRRRTHHLP